MFILNLGTAVPNFACLYLFLYHGLLFIALLGKRANTHKHLYVLLSAILFLSPPSAAVRVKFVAQVFRS